MFKTAIAIILSLAFVPLAQAQLPAQLPADLPPAEEAEVLTSGPVHEAFAEQYNANPVEGIVIKQKPPADIEELAPDQRPEGENVEWIPGYWAWDDDRTDFIWISGLWRNIPPGQRWVPGYWADVDGGYQWVPGFWNDEEAEQVNYLPSPPETLEAGANVASPGEDYFWVPGTWRYVDYRYQWRPGFWSPAYDNWVWIPARYVWSPRGYVYLPGYWDHRVPYRGVLYAPVYVRPRYYARPYRLIPRIVVNTTRLLLHLFVRPRYHHYYFGNYYDPVYATRWGIRPWHSYHGHHHHYDPLFSYYNWHYGRRGYNYANVMNDWERRVRANNDLRPQRTFRDERAFAQRNRNNPALQQVVLSQTMGELAEARRGDTQLARLVANTGDGWRRNLETVRNVEQVRRGFERSRDGQRLDGDRPAGAARRPGDNLAGNRTGPSRREGQGRPGNVGEQIAREVLQLPRAERRPRGTETDERNRPPRSADVGDREAGQRTGPRFPSRRPDADRDPSERTRPPIRISPRTNPATKSAGKSRRDPQTEPARTPPRTERPGRENPPRTERPRSTPRVNPAPRTERPRPAPKSAPKAERPRPVPKSAPAPKTERPRPAPKNPPAPRTERPRPAPKSSPKVERPRPAPKAAPAPRTIRPRPAPKSAPKVEPPRSRGRSGSSAARTLPTRTPSARSPSIRIPTRSAAPVARPTRTVPNARSPARTAPSVTRPQPSARSRPQPTTRTPSRTRLQPSVRAPSRSRAPSTRAPARTPTRSSPSTRAPSRSRSAPPSTRSSSSRSRSDSGRGRSRSRSRSRGGD